jgi:hypothetical protein
VGTFTPQHPIVMRSVLLHPFALICGLFYLHAPQHEISVTMAASPVLSRASRTTSNTPAFSATEQLPGVVQVTQVKQKGAKSRYVLLLVSIYW